MMKIIFVLAFQFSMFYDIHYLFMLIKILIDIIFAFQMSFRKLCTVHRLFSKWVEKPGFNPESF